MAFSYHSFIFPFVWVEKQIDFLSVFSTPTDNNIWVCTDSAVESNSLRTLSLDSLNKDPTEYDSFQFFNEAGRNLVFPGAINRLVNNFSVKNSHIRDLKYIINARGKKYSLIIDEIHLKIFDTGVAMISIDCHNSEYRSINDVKEINEYGRRLAMPFWPNSQMSCSKCADSLEISGNGIYFKDDFKSMHNNTVSLCYVSTIIRSLLNCNGKNIIFRAKATYNPNEIQIKPILDEKMYVACLIVDKELISGLLNDYTANGNEFSPENRNNLVELFNVDVLGKCSISDDNSQLNYLHEHIYTAEFAGNEPKLFSVTEQSYIKLIAKEDFDVRYFRSVYCQLIGIVLAQRMSIEKFQQEIITLSGCIGKRGKRITNKVIASVMNVQERYISFQNQFLFREITPKREGKHLYEKFQEFLNVYSENEVLKTQLSTLYELISTSQGYSFNKWGLVISLIAIEFNIFAFIQGTEGIPEIVSKGFSGLSSLLLLILGAIGIVIFVSRFLFRKK